VTSSCLELLFGIAAAAVVGAIAVLRLIA